MTTITDEFMGEMLSKSKNYSVVILKATPKRSEPGADKIVWEHGRRNFALRAQGLLSIVCPLVGDSEVRGVEIFSVGVEDVKKTLDEDPAVKAGILIYEVYTCRSFPGDALP
jgi:hypothetical protein